MPELPEVETVRKTLEQLVVGKTIQDISVHLPRIIQRPDDIEIFCRELKGSTITGIGRRGKFLKIFCDPWVIVSHLRMEGRYRVADQDVDLEKHTHVIFHFTDGTELRYKDVRQFGTMHLFPKGEEEGHLPLKKLGPEPLDPDQYRLDWFESVIRRRKTKIKPLLLNQEILVGLGNIYVDEALHSAKIHPERSANELTDKEVHLLYHSISETLSRAVEAGGSSVRSYVNGQGEMGMFQLQIRVYGRKNEPCYTCGNPIERMVVGGRGTHICPQCQT
ncbi:DNA-(apurinic or apyrimidinic site) lyase [Thermoactinomyces sp. DSM 45891]|uniref:DNA-formamidopyrimidine glycosylase n=1 Tax=Thermoactinomyces sp. DSM 45891 TaxID=1761907 RepID=UPI00091084F3|nr:DNA-formamidopyrimidine glycosylase [Thermoactinomyces sp. DSM 45891]SFX59308.1 DNA-(apurinic or apyrimidinic site) lyase [Thermoactinomyces sp. DSM 45891]